MNQITFDDVDAYKYNNIRSNKKRRYDFSNLCSKYIPSKKRFCGNLCHQKNQIFNRRCWMHKKVFSNLLPPVVIIMIVSDKIYNKRMWLNFLVSCDKHNVPLELLIYNEYMYKGTVRNGYNLISRFRPVAKVFLKKYHIFSLENKHASITYANVYYDMLKYVTEIPKVQKCFVITETSIPIRTPKTLYNTTMSLSTCALDISYNVKYSNKIPNSLPLRGRGKNFELVNHRAQCMYTITFLKDALPTLSMYSKYFGIRECKDGYEIIKPKLLRDWEDYTASMLDEFWLINSYIIHLYSNNEPYPIKYIKNNLESNLPKMDRLVVADFPEWRNNIRRSFRFESFEKEYCLKIFDTYSKKYFGLVKNDKISTSLNKIINYLRSNKKNVLFFRSVVISE